uniref:Helix-turn-helix n=1 Tax=Candidatus Kentrum sp. UNK TaxID=2126344 RepID=A0A450ZYS7_9GAMM|nr:MAG: Helix-turn-helix [Candidatus Kentron sp. UNK]VFK68632.1 MAG: Helix-turn-helix [Candidatus Kentron sp. UNK]
MIPHVLRLTGCPPPKKPLQPARNTHPIVRRIFLEANEMGWTRRRLAYEMNVDTRTIRRWERGEGLMPRIDQVAGILERMGLSLGVEDA